MESNSTFPSVLAPTTQSRYPHGTTKGERPRFETHHTYGKSRPGHRARFGRIIHVVMDWNYSIGVMDFQAVHPRFKFVLRFSR